MTVRTCTKVNIGLNVLRRRPDGYHDLETLFVPYWGLGDELTVEPASRFSIDIEREGGVDWDPMEDLTVRAWRLLKADFPQLPPVAIRLVKGAPVGAGLGGGSADAAAALVALNEAWGLGRTRAELVEIAARVGSDVPALVHGGPVVMEGRGELVAPFMQAGEVFPRLWLVLANPGVASSTREVYGTCASRVTDDARILYNMRRALASGELGRIASAMVNDLAEAAVRLHPEIGAAMALLREAGVVGAAVSGSGSTVFGLVPDETRGLEIAAFLDAKGLWARCVHTDVP